jgi:hypothetical protein
MSPTKVSVAGILDCGGGLRVVCTEIERMHYHVGLGELCFIVPGLLVEDPVPLAQAPWLIATVEKYVNGILQRHEYVTARYGFPGSCQGRDDFGLH